MHTSYSITTETSNLALLAWPKLSMALSPRALLVGGRGQPGPLIQVHRTRHQLLAFTLATILELCFILTLCYYSQNYSRIVIASLTLTILLFLFFSWYQLSHSIFLKLFHSIHCSLLLTSVSTFCLPAKRCPGFFQKCQEKGFIWLLLSPLKTFFLLL